MSTESPDRLEHRQQQVLWVGTGGREGVKPGSFYEYLINAWFKSDLQNRGRLSLAFPLTAVAYNDYMKGDLTAEDDSLVLG